MKVEIYSDVMCPWCYIGERRFARALAAFPGGDEIDVVFRPYQLDSNAPESAIPVGRYLARRFNRRVDAMLERVTEAAAGEGITMNWDRARAVNTFTAHRLVRLADREYPPEVQHALVDKLFEAQFTNGGDVGDHAQLTELAVTAGMNAGRVRSYLATNEGQQETLAELGRSREAGVQAVPTFVFDGQYVVQGAQPASTFLKMLEEVQQRGIAAGAVGEGDDCKDGSCVVAGDAG